MPKRRSLPFAVAATSVALLASGLTPSATATTNVRPEWGSVSAPGAVLKKGCNAYSYTYAVTPPPGDWAIEVFLTDKFGKALASAAFLGTLDPKVSTRAFRICKPVTRPGNFTIRTKLTSQDGFDYYEGWLPDTTFKLRSPKKKKSR